MDSSQLLGQIASTGVVGVLLVLALFALRDAHKQLKDEQQARIADAKQYLDLAMKLQEQVITAVTKLSEIVELWEHQQRLNAAEGNAPAPTSLRTTGGRKP